MSNRWKRLRFCTYFGFAALGFAGEGTIALALRWHPLVSGALLVAAGVCLAGHILLLRDKP